MAEPLCSIRDRFTFPMNDRPEVRETFAVFRTEEAENRSRANAGSTRHTDELFIGTGECSDRLQQIFADTPHQLRRVVADDDQFAQALPTRTETLYLDRDPGAGHDPSLSRRAFSRALRAARSAEAPS